MASCSEHKYSMRVYKYSMRIYKYSMRIYKYSMGFRTPAVDQSYSRAGANYFRLVRPLHALKCEQGRGVWGHAPPGKFFKIRHSEIASEAMFGPKKLLESPHL